MTTRDVYLSVNDADERLMQSIINRLEFRGKDESFVRLREDYLDKMQLQPSSRVLEVGCGTGVVARALAGRRGFTGTIVAIDTGVMLIEAARRLTDGEGLGSRIQFQVGDAHALDFEDESFDAVIAHTVISHVATPLAVLKEAHRILRPGGTLAVFDGDYASLSFGCPDPALAKAMEEAMLKALFNNPRVMRDMPLLLKQAGFEAFYTAAHVYAEMVKGNFWLNLGEHYALTVVSAGALPSEDVERWLAELRRAAGDGTFFASCNYCAYLARRT